MAIAKVILNGVTQMDVTQKSVTPASMLSGTTALKNDGTDITGTIASKTSSDMTVNGATVTAPAGYYANNASKTVASGSTGTPTATKGTVTNHSVSVTPSVTNTTGYITGGTKTGTAVTVSASELVSGTKTISASGTTDVTNYESVSVPSGSAKTPATTITANPTVSVNSSGLITATVSKTQSVTPTVSAGYVSSGTAGTITVSGSGTSQLTTQAAQTIHPSTTDQTIASGKYMTGAQTIKAVTTTNLTAANIVSGVTVKVGDSTDDDCVVSVTGTAETGGNDFIITLTKNASTGIWEPDCTYAQAVAAYSAGDDVTFNAEGYAVTANYDEFSGIFYSVYEYFSDGYNVGYRVPEFLWSASGVTEQYSETAYITSQANATPADVASGKKFFNANGYQVGTAATGGAPTLISSQTVELSCTSTSWTKLETLDVGTDVFFDGVVYVKIRDTGGRRSGYFYGSDSIIFNIRYINNASTVTSAAISNCVGWYASNSNLVTSKDNMTITEQAYYGLRAVRANADGKLEIFGRYSSSYSKTIDGTYKVDVYLLPYPGGTFA